MTLSKYKATERNGFVEFKVGASVSGKYPRIKPNHSRPLEVNTGIISGLAKQLYEYAVNCGFDNSAKLEALNPQIVQFGIYSCPEASPDSKQLLFVLRHLLWASLYNEALNDAWDSKIDIKTIRIIHKIFAKTLFNPSNKMVIDGYPKFEAYPKFKGLAKILQGLAELGVELVGPEKSYPEAIEPYLAALQYNFESNEWFTVCHLNERYTLRTFHLWKMGNAGGEAILEAIAFADGIRIPATTRVTPAFRRTVGIVMSNVSWTRDVLDGNPFGRTNEVQFRTGSKGDPLEDAVAGTTASVDEELGDLLMIKKALVDVMGEDENLLRYLDKVDNLVDGQNFAYGGGVKLTRDGEVGGSGCSLN